MNKNDSTVTNVARSLNYIYKIKINNKIIKYLPILASDNSNVDVDGM